MIAAAGALRLQRGERSGYTSTPQPACRSLDEHPRPNPAQAFPLAFLSTLERSLIATASAPRRAESELPSSIRGRIARLSRRVSSVSRTQRSRSAPDSASLTSHLLLTGAQVIAVERERDMCAILAARVGGAEAAVAVTADALQLKLSALLPDERTDSDRRLVVVGNLPYQIASPLLFQLLAQRTLVRRIVVMIQREVADRLLASVGTDAYSSMSAQVQMPRPGRARLPCGPRSVIPAPRVESAVVRLIPYATSAVPVRSLNNYATVVRAGFGQRRKMLRNSLAAQLDSAAMAALESCGIDLRRRAETLSLSEFALWQMPCRTTQRRRKVSGSCPLGGKEGAEAKESGREGG